MPIVLYMEQWLGDMQLFAVVVQAGSLTGAAELLDCSKQTVSRRLTALENRLGRKLLHRSTRALVLTQAGAAYAERCREITRLAAQANEALMSPGRQASIRITADRVLGEAVLAPIVAQFAEAYPNVAVELVLTPDKLDLAGESVDLAFRVGVEQPPAGMVQSELARARVRYCASPQYLNRRGIPDQPRDLGEHECIHADERSTRWPFRSTSGGVELVDVRGRLRLDSFALVKTVVLAGVGIGLFPDFVCRPYLQNGLLRSVLDDWTVEVGTVSMLHAHPREMPSAVRHFAELARGFCADQI